jgi:hypothetical protein
MKEKDSELGKQTRNAYIDAMIGCDAVVYGSVHRLTDTTKWCSFYVVSQGRIIDLTVSIARAIGRGTDKRGHMAVKACGVCPIVQTVDNLSRLLSRSLTPSKL